MSTSRTRAKAPLRHGRGEVVQGAVLPAGALRALQGEKEFMAAVEQRAAERGWVRLILPSYVLRCSQGHAVHWGRSVIVGWPDIVLFRPPRKIAWEGKSETGKATPQQTEMLAMLAACGFEVGIIRPSDLDWIEGVLV